jgi:hypothetical protein
MNRAYTSVAAALVVAICLSIPALADVTYTARFATHDLAFEPYGDGLLLRLPDTDLGGAVGQPWLPVRYVRVAIPVDDEVTGVRIDAAASETLRGAFAIASRPQPQPKSRRADRAPVPGLYTPPALVEYVATGHASGYPIVDLCIHPVSYDPASGALTVYREIQFTVETDVSANPYQPINNRSDRIEAIFADGARELVVNPDDVPESVSRGIATRGAGDVEQLIITDAAYVTSFQTLATWYTKKGVPTEVESTSWVYSNYSGRDNQEKIRNCIKDYWQNKGLVYVVLGGDVSRVPYRAAYAMGSDAGNNLPCDLYYSDLDGTWNADNDSRWGEYPSDNIDMYADVFVARAPVESTTECTRVINKALQYEASSSEPAIPIDYEKTALFAASYSDEATDDSLLKDLIDAESVPSGWTITKLYERTGNLSPSSLINALNDGYNLVNHSGHGDTTAIQAGGNNYVSANQLYSLTNDPRFSIMYSTSCYSGEFPATTDCCAERFALAPNGGGYYVGNSHYGWYYYGQPTMGLSARFDRYFFIAMFRTGYKYYNAAMVHGKAKDIGVGVAKSDEAERYCLYELNLFGCAETPIWTDTPASFSVSHPATLQLGPSSFEVSVSSGGSPVQGAQVCLWRGDEVYLIESTGANGIAQFSPNPSTEGTMFVTVTKHNFLPYEGSAQALDTGTTTASPTNWINPGWNWISFPLDPIDPYAASIFGPGVAENHLYRWDPVAKTINLYPDDYTDVETGRGYLLLAAANQNPSYAGYANPDGFEIAVPAQGWIWIGQPYDAWTPQGGTQIRNNTSGIVRAAAEDQGAADPWINWNWILWNSWDDSANICIFNGTGDTTSLGPWRAYLVWSNTENLTLIMHN